MLKKLGFGIVSALLLTACTRPPELPAATPVRLGLSFLITDCSSAALVAAINLANSNPGPHDITLAAGCTYTLSAVDNYYFGPNALPPIRADITITGGAFGATIARDVTGPAMRLFYVSSDASPPFDFGHLKLRNVTLKNGLAKGGNGASAAGGGLGAGGAIYAAGNVTLDRVTITSCTAKGGDGGVVDGSFGGGGGMGGAGAIGGGGGMQTNGTAAAGGNGVGGNEGGTLGLGGGSSGPEDASDSTGGGTRSLGGSSAATTNDGGNGFVSPGALSGAGAGFGGKGSDAMDAGSGGGGGFGGGGAPAFAPGFAGGGGGVGGGGGSGEIAGGFGGFGGGGGGAPSGGGGGGFGGGGAVGSSSRFGGSGGATQGGAGSGFGGAIFSNGGNLSVINSTLSGNSAIAGSSDGAGDVAHGSAVFLLRTSAQFQNVTIAGNTGPDAVFFYARLSPAFLQLFNVAIDETGNTLATAGGITIVAASRLSSAGVSDGPIVMVPGSSIGSSLLGPLQDNGGPTFTRRPLTGSALLAAGDPGTCVGPDVNGFDQRGVNRMACSIGAYEPDTLLANGSACAQNNECTSVRCIDGVCCDAVCGAGDTKDCQACTGAQTGGPDGACAPIVAATICDAALNECQNAGVCDGSSTVCPAKTNKDATTPCGTPPLACEKQAFCVGFTAACGSKAFDVGKKCDSAAGECENDAICVDGTATCPAKTKKSAVACGPTPGECENGASCDGIDVACPATTLKSGSACGPAPTICEVGAVCNGVSPTCPAKAIDVGKKCDSSAGECENDAFCVSGNTACPAKMKKSAVACGPTPGECENQAQCNGASVSCPTTTFKSGTACGPSPTVCEVGALCSGTSATCPAKVVAVGKTCAAPSGVCENFAVCVLGNTDCPAKTLKSGDACGAAALECENGATCTGASVDCPNKTLKNGDACGGAPAACEKAAACNGTDPTCPAKEIDVGKICDASSGPCENAGVCVGGNSACPSKSLKSGTTCRSAPGECDVPEICSGSSVDCPGNSFVGNDTPCSVGTCQSGTCAPTLDLLPVDLIEVDLPPPDLTDATDLAAPVDLGVTLDLTVPPVEDLTAPPQLDFTGVALDLTAPPVDLTTPTEDLTAPLAMDDLTTPSAADLTPIVEADLLPLANADLATTPDLTTLADGATPTPDLAAGHDLAEPTPTFYTVGGGGFGCDATNSGPATSLASLAFVLGALALVRRRRSFAVSMRSRSALLLASLALLVACGGSSTHDDLVIDSDDAPLVVVNVSATPGSSPRVFANTTVLPNGTAFVCPPIKEGSCTYYACTPRPAGSAAPATAGTVTIAGGLQSLVFSARTDGKYDPQQLTSALFAGGETLTATSSGTPDVASFSTTTKAPKPMTVSQPTIPSATDWTIDRTTAIELAWSGLTATETVSITIGANTNNPTEVECTFAGDVGHGTIPAAALAHLPAGNGFFEIVSQTRGGVSDAPWYVRLKVSLDAADTSGAILVGGAQLQ